MALNTRLGRAVLEITTDATKFGAGIVLAKNEMRGFEREIRSFAARHRQSFVAVGQATALVAGAVGAVTAAVVTLGQRGAGVADVRASFEGLATGVGSTAAALSGALRRGTVGAIADFELMKMANKALGAGLVANADDMEVLAGGARLLANRIGGDTAESFDKLTSAIASGRVASLKQLGLFVDVKAAVEAYAKAQSKSVGDLTDADRAAALQTATLRQLRTELKGIPADAADFSERIDQLRTRWKNFTDDLSVAIASSPVLATAMSSLSDGISRAFGDDQSARVKTLTGWVDRFALATMSAAQLAVQAAGFVRQGWGVLELAFSGVMSIVFLVGRAFTTVAASAAELATKIPGVGEKFQAMAWAARDAANTIAGMQTSFHQQAQSALGAIKGNSAFQSTLDGVSSSLLMVRLRMAAAAAQQTAGAPGSAAATRREQEFAAATAASAAALDKKAAAHRAYLNFIGEREIEDEGNRQQAEAAADAAARQLRNEIGEREIEDHKAVLDQQAADDQAYRSLKNELGEREIAVEAERQQRVAQIREQSLERWRRLGADLQSTFGASLSNMALGLRSFRDAFTDMWQGIRQSFANLLNQMVQDFAGTFLQGMLGAMRGQQGAWSTAFSSLFGGGRGGGGGVAQMAGSALPGLLGGGAGTAATWTAGSTVFGSGVPGAAGGAGGMGFLANPAFWTNPWTIAGIGAFALGMAVWKKGLFRGGWEGVEGNKRRDKFLGQWGDPSDKGVTGAGHKLASELTEMTGEHGGGSLYRNLQRADSKKEFESAQDAIIRLYASKKSKRKIQKFHEGGVIGEDGAPISHLLSGETLITAQIGESILTRQATAMLGGRMIAALNADRAGSIAARIAAPAGRLTGLGGMFGNRAGAPKMIAPVLPRPDLIAPVAGGGVGDAGMQPNVVNNVTNNFAGQLDRNIIKDVVIPALNKALVFNTGDFATFSRRYGKGV